jgi:hypothetical protein
MNDAAIAAQLAAQEKKMAEIRAKFVVYGDEHADITLHKGINVEGTLTKTLRMREPTVLENRAAAKMSGDAADVEVNLFATLCGLAPNDLNAMSQRDYTRVQAAYSGFTD